MLTNIQLCYFSLDYEDIGYQTTDIVKVMLSNSH